MPPDREDKGKGLTHMVKESKFFQPSSTISDTKSSPGSIHTPLYNVISAH